MDEIYQQSIGRVKEPTALAHTHARLIALQSFGMAVHSMDGLDLAQLLGSKQQLRGFAHDMAANQVSALEDMPAQTSKVLAGTDSASKWANDWANKVISQQVVLQLLQENIVVLDNVLALELCQSTLQHILAVDGSGGTQISTNPCNPGAKNAWYCFDQKNQELSPSLRQLTESLAGIAHAVNTISTGLVASGLVTESKKLPDLRVNTDGFLSVYEEDITYNHHLDAYMNQKNARVLTVLAYVNLNWSEPDKGQLRVFQSGLPHVDYAPLAGRVVLFKSREVFHAVMPSTFQRCAIQLWLMGD